MFMQLFFFPKVRPACHNIANGIKPGSDSKKTDKHAADRSKAVCWDVNDVCEMYKLFIQQCGQLLDKKTFFLNRKTLCR